MITKECRLLVRQLVLEEHKPIRHVARILGMARNTVKRCLKADTDQPRRDTRSQAGRFLAEHSDEVRNSFYTCENRCPPLQSLLRETYGVDIPLRTLERFCKPFREAARACLQQQAIHGRYETAPAQQLQIDFGEKVVQLGGQMTRLHFFVCKLGYSRRLFAKAYPSETQTAWLDGLESAFRYFGGLPYCIVCDNASSLVRNHYAKTAVERFTERFYQFCTYYGLKPIATAVCKPRSKGKVESGVKYLKGNLAGVNKPTIEDWNLWLEAWCRSSDERKLSTVFDGPRTPAQRWQIELPKMRALSKPPMIHTYVETRKVGNNDGLIRVDNKYYRVPQHLVGMKVQIQIDESMISVLQGGVMVATLDKTADVFNPQAQDLSNGEIEKEAYDKSRDKLAEDPQWQAYSEHRSALSADTRAYDDSIGWTEPKEQE